MHTTRRKDDHSCILTLQIIKMLFFNLLCNGVALNCEKKAYLLHYYNLQAWEIIKLLSHEKVYLEKTTVASRNFGCFFWLLEKVTIHAANKPTLQHSIAVTQDEQGQKEYVCLTSLHVCMLVIALQSLPFTTHSTLSYLLHPLEW